MAALTIEFPQTVWTVEFGGDEIVVAEVTMTGGTGGGGTFDGEHNDLDGRSTADAHPISAITGLTAALEAGGASALADLTDVDVETDPPAPDDVLAWDGTNWTPATLDGGSGLELGETSSTAHRGDHGKTAHDHSQVVTGNPHGTTAADVGADPAGTAAGLVDDLSGVSNQATARTNLGLGSAAVEAASAFATAAQGVDARTPTAHKTSHATGGTDALTASDIGAAAASHTHTGTQVTVDASGFNGNLTTSDDTVQEIAQKLDDLTVSGGSGDPASTALIAGAAYVSTPGPFTTSTGALTGTGHAGWTALHLAAGTYDAISIWNAANTANTVRLCVDSVGSNGLPGTLLVDAGTLDLSAGTGLRTLVFGSPLVISASTWVWCRVVVTSLSESLSVSCLRASDGNQWPQWAGSPSTEAFTNRSVAGWRTSSQATGAGEQPATPTTTQMASSVRVWMRRSA